MTKGAYIAVIDLIYWFYSLKVQLFDYQLSFINIFCGAFLLGLALYIFFRLTD